MIRGVTLGYKFEMRYAYGGKAVEIKNFLGEKIVRKIPALESVKISINENEKG